VWSRSGEHGRLGSLKVVSVLRVLGPSLFGIRAWFRVSNLGRTCRCLDRMIVESMFSFSDEGVLVEQMTQEIREQQLVGRFDFFTVQNGPQRGAVILCFLGFGVVRLVGIDPDEARVGNIVVEVVHSGFYIRARVWLKVIDGVRGWASTLDLQANFYFTSYLA